MGSWKGWKGVTVMTIKCLENREIELQKFALQKARHYISLVKDFETRFHLGDYKETSRHRLEEGINLSILRKPTPIRLKAP